MLTYLSAPFRGNELENIHNAKTYANKLHKMHVNCFVPHIALSYVFSDRGMTYGEHSGTDDDEILRVCLDVLEHCSSVIFFPKLENNEFKFSEGMLLELERAMMLGLPITYGYLKDDELYIVQDIDDFNYVIKEEE